MLKYMPQVIASLAALIMIFLYGPDFLTKAIIRAMNHDGRIFGYALFLYVVGIVFLLSLIFKKCRDYLSISASSSYYQKASILVIVGYVIWGSIMLFLL